MDEPEEINRNFVNIADDCISGLEANINSCQNFDYIYAMNNKVRSAHQDGECRLFLCQNSSRTSTKIGVKLVNCTFLDRLSRR